eukprot:363779-Chlamydomonas_euryale.AAC.1
MLPAFQEPLAAQPHHESACPHAASVPGTPSCPAAVAHSIGQSRQWHSRSDNLSCGSEGWG